MVKPIITSNTSFDAKKDYTLTYSWAGSLTLKKSSMLTIKTNDEYETIVYDEPPIKNSELTYTIPANTLTNGETYIASLVLLDSDDNAISETVEFIIECYTTPTFKIENIDKIMHSTSIVATVFYEQEQGIKLDSYKFYLYNDSNMLLAESDIKYYLPGESNNENDFAFVYDKLSDNHNYMLIAKGVTVKNIEVEGEPVKFAVECYSTLSDQQIEFTPSDNGNITANFLIRPMEYESNNISFIDDKKIDLTDENAYVTYSKGFNVSDDFTIQTILSNINYDTDLMVLENNKEDNITISNKIIRTYDYIPVSEGTDGSFLYNGTYYIKEENVSLRKFCIYITDSNNLYAESNHIDMPNSSDNILLWVQRKGGLYYIKIEILT